MTAIRKDNPEGWSTIANSDQEVEYPEDTEWEDEENVSITDSQSPSFIDFRDASNLHLSQRKHRKPITITTGRRSSVVPHVRQTRSKANNTPREPIITSKAVANHAKDGTRFILEYVFDIAKSAIIMLKRPLKLLAFMWLLALVMNMIGFQVRKVAYPACWLPIIKDSVFCHSTTTKWVDYDRLAEVQSRSFGEMLGETVGNSALSLDIKQAEMATADLATLVRVSNLKSKKSLESHLMNFNQHAKKAGRGLQKLSSKVGGAVDSIMAVNDYALSSIEQARAKEPAPWSFAALVNPNAKQRTQEIITDSFDQAMGVLSNNMQHLIVEAELNLQRLDDLEEALSVLHEVIAREEKTVSQEKDEVLAQLWTSLGGNKRELRNFQQNLALLQNLGEYRKQARAHVAATLQSLEALSEDMEDLRERIAAPELMGPDVPPEVHMKSIQTGLERMKEGRIKARELEEAALKRLRTIGAEDDDNC
ncbi:hypothetical protein CVT24_010001 [Panaeolus cyanescens]|uniref:Uncharacterized protein n=1 Tax=Panaeolus cyanescens TaxID=181874 RepID=A0A409VY77_9AGAR|nr:hypothetical protein CVT24_010001 [Panaeolus cyanescens]